MGFLFMWNLDSFHDLEMKTSGLFHNDTCMDRSSAREVDCAEKWAKVYFSKILPNI